tara:strand:- start:60 stop:767 length:708 start_codon:yes stop_codon:yes gene_type:complete
MKLTIDIIRSIIIYLFAFTAFLIFGPIVLTVTIIDSRNSAKYIIPFCNFMIRVFGCKLKVHGSFPDNNDTFVIMSNHVSFLDVFAIPSVFSKKKNFSAIAASKNFKIPIFSSFLKRMRVVSIDRSNRNQAIAGIKKSEAVLKDGYHITILPEGTRTLDGTLGNFKKGGFHLAADTCASILPIITKGLFEIKPRNGWIIKPGTIEIYIKKPILSQDKSVNELLEETNRVFMKTLES